jgi:hypothetical protein
VFDLTRMVVLEGGCYGGFGDLGGYRGASYQLTTRYSISSLQFNVVAREVNDPWYQIPFIIGFGAGNTWGVTKTDRIIVLSVFYSLCGLTSIMFCIGCLISMITAIVSYLGREGNLDRYDVYY